MIHPHFPFLHPSSRSPQLIAKKIIFSDHGGFAQDYLLCLNRVPGEEYGAEYFKTGIRDVERMVANRKKERQGQGQGEGEREGQRLKVEMWWGDQDGMVPKAGRGEFIRVRVESQSQRY